MVIRYTHVWPLGRMPSTFLPMYMFYHGRTYEVVGRGLRRVLSAMSALKLFV